VIEALAAMEAPVKTLVTLMFVAVHQNGKALLAILVSSLYQIDEFGKKKLYCSLKSIEFF
jgi:hypothetical protein